MQVFIQQGGEWRIAESIVAPTDQIVANGDGFGTKQEKGYGKRRENRNNLLNKRRLFYLKFQETFHFNILGRKKYVMKLVTKIRCKSWKMSALDLVLNLQRSPKKIAQAKTTFCSFGYNK